MLNEWTSDMTTENSDPIGTRRRTVVEAAKSAGLLTGDNSALGARIPRRLITRAKERSGIASTTDLVEYALAKVALEDDFGVKLVRRKGSIPADIELGV
jgi:hypothetical protein